MWCNSLCAFSIAANPLYSVYHLQWRCLVFQNISPQSSYGNLLLPTWSGVCILYITWAELPKHVNTKNSLFLCHNFLFGNWIHLDHPGCSNFILFACSGICVGKVLLNIPLTLELPILFGMLNGFYILSCTDCLGSLNLFKLTTGTLFHV